MAKEKSKRARVLVVDDSRVMRKAIERILETEFDLIEAGDGQEGWDKLNSNTDIDVVISDVQMPVLDGYGMICRIRAADSKNVSDVPIIVITSAEDEITKERAYACGANDFITKPIDSNQLITALRAHTGSQVVSTATEKGSVDPLTLISNRNTFVKNGKKLFVECQKKGDMLSLIRLDVDFFDDIREHHGDDVADQVLVWTSKILLKIMRKQDAIGQLGRAQFAILTASSGRVESAVLCDRIRAAVSAGSFERAGISIPVSLSVGLATSGHDTADSIEDLVEIASRRAAVARSRGGNQLIAGDNDHSGTIEETIMEEPDIESALDILAGEKSGNFDPYALNLALRVLPLLEYCDEKFELEMARDISALKARLMNVR